VTGALRHPVAAAVLAAVLSAAVPARGAEDPLTDPFRHLVGGELDLLPVVISAADGELGAGFHLWGGRGLTRVRLVTAVVYFPDALTDAPFRDRELTAFGVLYDRFFRPGFRGPFVGGGAELWWTEVGTDLGPQRRERVNPVATLGAGWVYPVWRGLYLCPSATGHVLLGETEIELGGERLQSPRFVPEASLRIGWTHAL
jgi:hypothetical protein